MYDHDFLDDIIPWPVNIKGELAKAIKRVQVYTKVCSKKNKPLLDAFISIWIEKIESRAKMAQIDGDISSQDLDMIMIKIGYHHLLDQYPILRVKVAQKFAMEEIEETALAPTL